MNPVSEQLTPTPTSDAASPAEFEQALAELEKIVQRLEQGQQSLIEALAEFERGIQLAKICEQGLKDAEQLVEQLLQGPDGTSLTAFKTENSST